MNRRNYHWVEVRTLSPAEKLEIAETCSSFIDTVLKPRFLPEIRPTKFNYPVGVLGKWRGSRYSFITRYRSGFRQNAGEEFDAPFTRLDFIEESVSEIRFDIMWHRHTGRWFRLYNSVSLQHALQLMQTDELLWPL